MMRAEIADEMMEEGALRQSQAYICATSRCPKPRSNGAASLFHGMAGFQESDDETEIDSAVARVYEDIANSCVDARRRLTIEGCHAGTGRCMMSLTILNEYPCRLVDSAILL